MKVGQFITIIEKHHFFPHPFITVGKIDYIEKSKRRTTIGYSFVSGENRNEYCETYIYPNQMFSDKEFMFSDDRPKLEKNSYNYFGETIEYFIMKNEVTKKV